MANPLTMSRRNSGFSMVELMVALTVGLLVLAAVAAVFVNSSKNYKTTDSLARLQENARIAMQVLTNDIRRAGYVGCMGSIENVKVNLNDGVVGGVKYVNGVPLSPFVGTNGSTSDSLTLQYLELGNSVALTASMQGEADDLTVAAGHDFRQYDIVAVTDCDKTDIFQITNDPSAGTIQHTATSLPSPHKGNSTANLSKTYSTDARIAKFSQLQYRVGTGASGRPALFRGSDELVEGVESLQVTYGLRPSGTPAPRWPQRYVTFSGVPTRDGVAPEWQNVVSIRVGLLGYTYADTATDTVGHDIDSQGHTVNDANIAAANDRRVRKTFLTTVDLRNVR